MSDTALKSPSNIYIYHVYAMYIILIISCTTRQLDNTSLQPYDRSNFTISKQICLPITYNNKQDTSSLMITVCLKPHAFFIY